MKRRICWLCGSKIYVKHMAVFQTRGSKRLHFVCDDYTPDVWPYNRRDCLASVRLVGQHLQLLSRRGDKRDAS